MDPIPYMPPEQGQEPDWYVEGMALECRIDGSPWFKTSRPGLFYSDYEYRPLKEKAA